MRFGIERTLQIMFLIIFIGMTSDSASAEALQEKPNYGRLSYPASEGVDNKSVIKHIRILFDKTAGQDGPVKAKIDEIKASGGCGSFDAPSPENTVLLEYSGGRDSFRKRYRTVLIWTDCGSLRDSKPALALDFEILTDEYPPDRVMILLYGMGGLPNDRLPPVPGISRPFNGCVSECG